MSKTKKQTQPQQALELPTSLPEGIITLAFYGDVAQHLLALLRKWQRTNDCVIPNGITTVRKVVEAITGDHEWCVYEEEVAGQKRWLEWSVVEPPQKGVTVFLSEAWSVRMNPDILKYYVLVLLAKTEDLFLNSHNMVWKEGDTNAGWVGQLTGKDNETGKAWSLTLYEPQWGDIIKERVFQRWEGIVYLERKVLQKKPSKKPSLPKFLLEEEDDEKEGKKL